MGSESLEEADKQYKEVEADVAALTRRIMLMEEEDKKAADTLCNTVTKLAITPRMLTRSSRLSRLLRTPASTMRSPLRSWTRTSGPPSRWLLTTSRSLMS